VLKIILISVLIVCLPVPSIAQIKADPVTIWKCDGKDCTTEEKAKLETLKESVISVSDLEDLIDTFITERKTDPTITNNLEHGLELLKSKIAESEAVTPKK